MSDPDTLRSPQRSAPAIVPALGDVLRWIVTSIGISGVFLAIGFIVESAYQDRLGYRLGTGDNLTALTIEAGTFLLSLLVMPVVGMADHPYATGLLVLALAALVLARGRIVQFGTRLRRPGGIALLALLVLLEITALDVPAMGVRGLLVHGVSSGTTRLRGTLGELVTTPLLQEEVCARLETEQYSQVGELRGDFSCSVQADYQRRRNSRFLINILLTLGLAMAAFTQWLTRRGGSSHEQFGKRWQAACTVFLALALLDLLLLPYSYAKTTRSTLASEVLVYLDDRPETKPEHGFLLYERRTDLVLFHKNEQHIWVLPKDKVHLIKIEGERDVVQFFFKKQLGDVSNGEPPPPTEDPSELIPGDEVPP